MLGIGMFLLNSGNVIYIIDIKNISPVYLQNSLQGLFKIRENHFVTTQSACKLFRKH